MVQADYIGQRDLTHEARKVREIAQKTCMEAAWYLAPSRAQLLADCVAATLNATVLRFIRRNPAFSGGISILAHSLGSAMVCDLLAHQPLAPRSSLHHVVDTSGGEFSVPAAQPPASRPPRPPQQGSGSGSGSGSARAGRAAARVAAVAALQERNAQRMGEAIYSGGAGSSAGSSRKRLPSPAQPAEESGGATTPKRQAQHGTGPDGEPTSAPDTPAIYPPHPPAGAAAIGEAAAKSRHVRPNERKARLSRSYASMHGAPASGASEGFSGGTGHMHPYPPAAPLCHQQDSTSGHPSHSHSAEGPLPSSESSGQRGSLADEHSLRPSSMGTTHDAISVSGWGAESGGSPPQMYPDTQHVAITLRLSSDELHQPLAAAEPAADTGAGGGGSEFMWPSPRPHRGARGRSRGPSRSHSRGGSSTMGYYTAHSTSASGGGSLGGSLGGSVGQPLGEGREQPDDVAAHAWRSQSATEPHATLASDTAVAPTSISETGPLSRAAAAAAAAAAVAAGGAENQQLQVSPEGARPTLQPPKQPPSPATPLISQFEATGGAPGRTLPVMDEIRSRGRPPAPGTPEADRGAVSEEETSSRELDVMGTLALRSWPGREVMVAPFANGGAERSGGGSPQQFTTSTTAGTATAVDLRSEPVPFWSGSAGWNSFASSGADGAAGGALMQWMPMHEVPDFPGSPGQVVDVAGRRSTLPPQLPPAPSGASRRNASEIERQSQFTFSQHQDSPVGFGGVHGSSSSAEGGSRRSRGGSRESGRQSAEAAAMLRQAQSAAALLRAQESPIPRERPTAARPPSHASVSPRFAAGPAMRRRGADLDLAERYQLGDLQVCSPWALLPPPPLLSCLRQSRQPRPVVVVGSQSRQPRPVVTICHQIPLLWNRLTLRRLFPGTPVHWTPGACQLQPCDRGRSSGTAPGPALAGRYA